MNLAEKIRQAEIAATHLESKGGLVVPAIIRGLITEVRAMAELLEFARLRIDEKRFPITAERLRSIDAGETSPPEA